MKRLDLTELRSDIAILVEQAIVSDRIVNVPVIAERIRQQHEHLNIALEDIEALVLQSAQMCTFPIEFDGTARDEYDEQP
ncbi:hypothetical protein [Pseudaminobacter sp. NGMCC 1.201702]|uniref:hypothetical protein n=1 Tax=Pseudaminobacter sp. NGMCC 1.201702 TaxID=3391825 RepID=UPI0039EF209C